MIPANVTNEVWELVDKQPAEEVCGFIIRNSNMDGYVVRVAENILDDPSRAFVMNGTEWYMAQKHGHIVAVFHSHPGGGAPSEQDQRSCNALGIDYLVFDPVARYVHRVVPQHPWDALLAQAYRPGVSDCVALVEYFYSCMFYMNLGISNVRPHDMDVHDWVKDNAGCVVRERHGEFGFYRCQEGEPKRVGDVLCFSVSDRITGIGVYVGRGQMLTQIEGGLSRLVDITPGWNRRMELHLRHERVHPL